MYRFHHQKTQCESDDHYLQDKYPKYLHARQNDHVVPPGLRVHIQLLRAVQELHHVQLYHSKQNATIAPLNNEGIQHIV